MSNTNKTTIILAASAAALSVAGIGMWLWNRSSAQAQEKASQVSKLLELIKEYRLQGNRAMSVKTAYEVLKADPTNFEAYIHLMYDDKYENVLTHFNKAKLAASTNAHSQMVTLLSKYIPNDKKPLVGVIKDTQNIAINAIPNEPYFLLLLALMAGRSTYYCYYSCDDCDYY